MILNYDFHPHQNSQQPTLIFVHGLFGSLSNLGMLARAFYESHAVVQLDVRNHGKSEHSDQMNYRLMAQDILDTLDHLNIQNFSIIGHSMGGKIAMRLASLAPERIEKLAVLDIAPFAYQQNHHDQIFKALFAVEQAQIESRAQAIEIMKQHIHEDMVIQFLLKSFSKGQWLFNVQALYNHYADIISWETQLPYEKEALFLRGSVSPYIGKNEHHQAIMHHFPQAEVIEISGAGHWLHAEKTAEVLQELQKFLD